MMGIYEYDLRDFVIRWINRQNTLKLHFCVDRIKIICCCNGWYWTSGTIYDTYVMMRNNSKISAGDPRFFERLTSVLIDVHNDLICLANWVNNRSDLDGFIYYQ